MVEIPPRTIANAADFIGDAATIGARNMSRNQASVASVDSPQDLASLRAGLKHTHAVIKNHAGKVIYDGMIPDVAFEKTESRLGMLGMVGMMGPAVLAGVGTGVGWVGSKLKLGFVSTAGEAMHAPKKAAAKEVGQVFGGRVGTLLEGSGTRLAGALADPIEGVAHMTPVPKVMRGLAEKSSSRNLAKAMKFAGDHEKLIEAAPAAAKGPLGKMLQIVRDAGSRGQVDMKAFDAAQAEFAKIMEKNPSLMKEMEAATAKAGKGAAKFTHYADKARYAAGAAKTYSNIGETVRELPKNISKASVGHAVFNGAFIGASAVSLASGAHSFVKTKEVLDAMPEGEITRHERSRAYKNSAIRGVVDTANLVLNVKQAGKNVPNMLVYFIPMGISMAAGAILGESQLTTMYKEMNNAQAKGQKLDAQAYASFLAEASKKLNARGGANGKFTKAVALLCEERNMMVRDLLRDGVIDNLIEEVIERGDTQKAGQKADISHVDRLSGRKAALESKGPISSKIIAEHQSGDGLLRR
jgi:hypothetical protein